MSKWQLIFSATVDKQLAKIDQAVKKRIIGYLENRVLSHKDPRVLGKALAHNLSDYWRFRVGDYRIICEINDTELTVMVVRIGHRREIYD